MPIQPAQLILQPDGTPYSETYGDIYHSAHGGPDQAQHVFLGGNNLPQRWRGRDRFVILETGFGLGLNFLATWAAWAADPQACRQLHFISVEKHPFSAADLAIAHAAWPQFAALAKELRANWPLALSGFHRLELAGGRVVLTLIFGDATRELGQIEAEADAFYLDGFSPARNPELWTPDIAKALARLATPGATLATWSVAGHVRAALDGAGFDLEKRPGFAGKRQMLCGRNRSRRPPRQIPPTDRSAIIIGAGLAGSTVAESLGRRGWQVTVLERAAEAALGASGNPAGVLRPWPSADDNRLARLSRAGFFASLALLHRLGPGVAWQACGVLHLARDAAHAEQQRRAVTALAAPDDFLQWVEADAASRLAGLPLPAGGWYFPGGGWVAARSLCTAALNAYPDRLRLRCNAPVDRIVRSDSSWQAEDASGQVLATAPYLIIAGGHETARFPALAHLGIRGARGQTTHLAAPELTALARVVCRSGYLTPALANRHVLGATFIEDDPDPTERLQEHRDNLATLRRLLIDAPQPDPAALHGHVGFRPLTPDRLPVLGWLPEAPGLGVASGYGARGLVWCALLAELLAASVEGEPLPMERDLVRAVSPQRFHHRP